MKIEDENGNVLKCAKIKIKFDEGFVEFTETQLWGIFDNRDLIKKN